MRLGTSTNLIFARPDGSHMDVCDMMEIVSASGFKLFDMNFLDWACPGSPFLYKRVEIVDR
jgi:hypothetical protein